MAFQDRVQGSPDDFLREQRLSPAVDAAATRPGGLDTSHQAAYKIAACQEQVQDLLDDAVREQRLPCAVFGAMDRSGAYIAQAAAGPRGLDRPDEAMTFDTAFAIFSCSKIITGIACMQLVEQGKLDFDAPAENILPELADLDLLSGGKAKTKLTLRHLLTHTSGLAYTFFSPEVNEWYEANGGFIPEDPMSYKHPLLFEPGTDWAYGTGLDWAARMLEKVTGMSINDYCRKYVWEPLGCQHFQFNSVPKGCEDRLVSMHFRTPDGLVASENLPVIREGKIQQGGSGLVTTTDDFLKCLYILINEGKGANGTQILQPQTVDDVWRDQLIDMEAGKKDTLDRPMPVGIPAVTNAVAQHPGVRKSWGIAGGISKDPLPSGRSANSVWWAGLANLFWMADREKGIVSLFSTQILPFWDAEALQVNEAMEKALYEGLA